MNEKASETGRVGIKTTHRRSDPFQGLLTRDVKQRRSRWPADRVTALEGSKHGGKDKREYSRNRIMFGISEQTQTRLDESACTNIPKETGVSD